MAMKARMKCLDLIDRFYKEIPLRDRVLNDAIRGCLRPGWRVLDAGCGRDAPIASLHAGEGAHCFGVDLVEQFDPIQGVSVLRGDLNHLPFPDETFDLLFSRSVIEHLAEPRRTFMEFARVLRPGGIALLVTPNKYDYASIAARLVPSRFHRLFLHSTVGEDVYDNFPTFFRCNTPGDLAAAVKGSSLKIEQIRFIRHYPYYLTFSVPLFYLGVAYDRLITRLGLNRLQPTIFVELTKAKPTMSP